jgi:hypothetical protein
MSDAKDPIVQCEHHSFIVNRRRHHRRRVHLRYIIVRQDLATLKGYTMGSLMAQVPFAFAWIKQ